MSGNLPIPPDKLPNHNDLNGIGPNDHHDVFTINDHSQIDHSGLPGIPVINDNIVSSETIWSSQKINDIAGNIGNSLIDDTQITTSVTWSSSKISSIIDSIIDDNSNNATNTWSSQKIYQEISSLIDDTIEELDTNHLWSSLKIKQKVDEAAQNTFLDAATIIDDTQISTDTTWSSQKINDELQGLIQNPSTTDINSIDVSEVSNNKTWDSTNFKQVVANYYNVQPQDLVNTDEILPYKQRADVVIAGGATQFSGSCTNTIEKFNTAVPVDAYIQQATLTQNIYQLAGTSNSSNDRGVFGAGSYDNIYGYSAIQYLTISQCSNTQIFGNLIDELTSIASSSNGINDRGLFAGGRKKDNLHNYIVFSSIQYITISQLGNASLFSYLSVERWLFTSTSNLTHERAIFAAGYDSNGVTQNRISYVTINQPSNALFFGYLTNSSILIDSTSNGPNERAVFTPVADNLYITYVTINQPSNASTFGELIDYGSWKGMSADSDATGERGVLMAGFQYQPLNRISNLIQYITISQLGNASLFGHLTNERYESGSASNGR